jgi:hypothetical protein
MKSSKKIERIYFQIVVYFINSQYSKTPIETEISVSTEHDDDDDDEEYPIDPSAFETNDDYLLALMLQHEYNNEFNGMMKKYESTVNRNSKSKRILLNLFSYKLILIFS